MSVRDRHLLRIPLLCGLALLLVLGACASEGSDEALHNCVVQLPSNLDRGTPMSLGMPPFTYPPAALQSVTELGGVVVEFSLDVDGRPFDIDAAVACPTGLFEAAALRDFATVMFATPTAQALENRHLKRVIYRIEGAAYPQQLDAECKQRAEQMQKPVACYF